MLKKAEESRESCVSFLLPASNHANAFLPRTRNQAHCYVIHSVWNTSPSSRLCHFTSIFSRSRVLLPTSVSQRGRPQPASHRHQKVVCCMDGQLSWVVYPMVRNILCCYLWLISICRDDCQPDCQDVRGGRQWLRVNNLNQVVELWQQECISSGCQHTLPGPPPALPIRFIWYESSLISNQKRAEDPSLDSDQIS